MSHSGIFSRYTATDAKPRAESSSLELCRGVATKRNLTTKYTFYSLSFGYIFYLLQFCNLLAEFVVRHLSKQPVIKRLLGVFDKNLLVVFDYGRRIILLSFRISSSSKDASRHSKWDLTAFSPYSFTKSSFVKFSCIHQFSSPSNVQ